MKVYILLMNGEAFTDKKNTARMWLTAGACRSALQNILACYPYSHKRKDIKEKLETQWKIVELELTSTPGKEVSAWEFLLESPASRNSLKKKGFPVAE